MTRPVATSETRLVAKYGYTMNPGFPFRLPQMGPFYTRKAAAPTRSFFIVPSSRF